MKIVIKLAQTQISKILSGSQELQKVLQKSLQGCRNSLTGLLPSARQKRLHSDNNLQLQQLHQDDIQTWSSDNGHKEPYWSSEQIAQQIASFSQSDLYRQALESI